MTYNHTSKSVIIGTETSFGTGGSPNKALGICIDDVQSNLTKEIIESFCVGSLEVQHLSAGIQQGKISFSGEYQYGKLLEYVFGTVGHADTASDTTHTYTVSAVTSATIHSALDGTTDTSLVYTGMFCESLEISAALNETVKMNASFTGKFPTVGSSATAHVQSSIPVSPHSYVTITVGGSVASETQEANITITKDTKFTDGMGSNDHQNGAQTQFKVEFSAKVGFDSNTYHDMAGASETASNFIFDVDNGVTLGSGQRALTITISALTMDVNEVVTVGELVYVDIKGTGTLSSATSVDNIDSTAW